MIRTNKYLKHEHIKESVDIFQGGTRFQNTDLVLGKILCFSMFFFQTQVINLWSLCADKKICVSNRKNVDVNKCKCKWIANVNVSVKQNDVM